MQSFLINPALQIKGEIVLSGDKSITHRAIIISAISSGKTIIENVPDSEDCLNTVRVFKQLGVKIITLKEKSLVVSGRGLFGLNSHQADIFVGESGTTLRLLLGILAGQDFEITVKGGKSLCKRPMLRVTQPLRMMGAKIKSEVRSQKPEDKNKKVELEEYPPITIRGGKLKAVTYKIPVASAQVKSALLLAGIYAKGVTQVIEPIKTRDHTERMLKLYGADIKIQGNQIFITGNKELKSPGRFYVPADISSAAFFIVLAAITPDSHILLEKVSLNYTRTGIINVLKRMGADIKFKILPTSRDPDTVGKNSKSKSGEPMGDIIVKSSKLKGTVVKKSEIPALIDELPILMVAACFAQGKTVFEAVQELRVKETDRVKSMCFNLKKMGADVKVIKADESEQIVIQGVQELRGAVLKSFGDHRTAMSMIVAALRARGVSRIDDLTCVNKSFPDFLSILTRKMHLSDFIKAQKTENN